MTIGAFRCGLGSQVLVIKLVPHACGVFDESRIDEGIVGDDEVVIRACDAMEEEGVVEFEVTGFGLGEWPVDVGYDLATVVTDLSVAYAHVSAGGGVGEAFDIDFCGQGVERLIRGVVMEDEVLLTLEDRLEPSRNQSMRVPREELADMLGWLLCDFSVHAARLLGNAGGRTP